MRQIGRIVPPFIATAILAALPLFTSVGSDKPGHNCEPAKSGPWIVRESKVFAGNSVFIGKLKAFPGALIVTLEGGPRQMGFMHGSLFKLEIADRVDRELGEVGWSDRLTAARSYYLSFPAWAKDELSGMSEGSGIDLLSLVLLNLKNFPEKSSGLKPNPPATGFTIYPDKPDWAVFIRRFDDGPDISTLSRPGWVGALAGMREDKCCLTLSGEIEPQEMIELVENLRTGLCDKKPETVDRNCRMSAPNPLGVNARFDCGHALLCLDRPDKGFAGVDVKTGEWLPACAACKP